MRDMRKPALVMTSLLLLCTLVCSAQDDAVPNATAPKWHASFEDALLESKRTDKPVMMEINGRPWCPPCVDQYEKVYRKKEFQAWAADHVVLLDIQVGSGYDKKLGHPKWFSLMRKYELQGIPSVVFLDHNEQVLGKLTPASDVATWLEKANQIVDRSDAVNQSR